jgi:endonuclease/exonuclease/phosphatase family metal-dependent hydrolase
MTFNLRYAEAKDNHPWEKRRPVMEELLKNEQPDIIGTQEGLYNQLTDLQSDLSGYEWIGVGREGDHLGEHVAVFYKKDRLKALEWNHFWLSDKPNVVASASWGNKTPRMVTWVKFEDLQTKNQFYFVNTHLDDGSAVSRKKSAELIINALKDFDPGLPVVLTGDFNTSAGGEIYQMLMNAQLQDAFKSAKQRVNDTFGTFHNYNNKNGGGSSNRIDWILFRGQVKSLRGEIVTYTKDGEYPSDHYPVMVDLVLDHAKSGGNSGNSGHAEQSFVYQKAYPELQIAELVPNSNEKGSFNYVEIYNAGNDTIDLNGYKIAYFFDPKAPFVKGKWNLWTITKDAFSTSSLIKPKETKVIWIKKQPCCYDLGINRFWENYGLNEHDLPPDQLLAVFTPGENQGLNGTNTEGRAVALLSPDNILVSGVEYNKGKLDVRANESVIYKAPDAFSIIMKKLAANRKPTPGTLAEGQG